MSSGPSQAAFGQAFPPADRSLNSVKRDLIRSMIQEMGRDPKFASNQDWFYALAYFLRGRLSAARIRTWRRNFDPSMPNGSITFRSSSCRAGC